MADWWQEAADWWRQDLVQHVTGEALKVLAILIVGWLALRYLVAPLGRLLERGRVDPSTASFLVNTARAVILAGVLLAVLQGLGVPTASLLALLGAAGLAVALSLQNSLANFAAGLLVLSFRIVRLDDQVEVGDFRGRVAEMLPFHIVLITADNQRITVPNTLLTTGGVRNHSALPLRRAQWNLTLATRDDLAAVREALRARLAADPRVLAEPEPQLFVQEWAEDKHVLAVQAWTATANYPAVQQELLEALGARLDELRRPPA
jgi:small conductance mechanosensitive channel